jgi:hypothetical protein
MMPLENAAPVKFTACDNACCCSNSAVTVGYSCCTAQCWRATESALEGDSSAQAAAQSVTCICWTAGERLTDVLFRTPASQASRGFVHVVLLCWQALYWYAMPACTVGRWASEQQASH